MPSTAVQLQGAFWRCSEIFEFIVLYFSIAALLYMILVCWSLRQLHFLVSDYRRFLVSLHAPQLVSLILSN